MIRTRFAPSPTGFMHIGGVRTALFAYLIAKQNNGKFILRIEDTDVNRYVEGATQVIYDTLNDLGLNWDEGPDIGGDYGPYIQSERKDIYFEYAKKLIEQGDAYYCFCSDERIENLKDSARLAKKPYKYDGFCKSLTQEEIEQKIKTEKHVIRFKMPNTGVVSFIDEVYGEVRVNANELEDLIIIKSDKMPTYNFANIIDDSLMKITHVIRGNEYLSSTPKYIKMYEALEFEVPKFIHLPIIKKDKDSDKKLSKRDNDATVASLQKQGYLNKSIINMLALTGWSPESYNEIFSLNGLIKEFKISGIGKSNAVFDHNKLNWINNHYIKEMDKDEYYDWIKKYLNQEYLNVYNEAELKEMVLLYQEQLHYGQQINDLIKLFFEDSQISEEALIIIDDHQDVIKAFLDLITENELWNEEIIKNIINEIKSRTGKKGKDLFMPIRIAGSHEIHGPELIVMFKLLGRDKIIKNINEVLKEK